MGIVIFSGISDISDIRNSDIRDISDMSDIRNSDISHISDVRNSME